MPNGNTREKGTGGDLLLPAMVLDIIRARPRLGTNPYVLRDRKHAPSPASLMASNNWTAGCHCRSGACMIYGRTARSLMSRASIRPDIAERVLGHAINGVGGIYDRHQYREEKAQALAALAKLIESIVHPTDKVVPMHRRK